MLFHFNPLLHRYSFWHINNKLFPQWFLLNQIIVSPSVHIFYVISLFAAKFEQPKIGLSGKESTSQTHPLEEKGINFVPMKIISPWREFHRTWELTLPYYSEYLRPRGRRLFNHFLNGKFKTLANGKSLQTTISNKTLSQTSPGFLSVSNTSLLKTPWEKEKLLVTSNFSFSHSVFYPFGKLSTIYIKMKIVVCKLFQFGRV